MVFKVNKEKLLEMLSVDEFITKMKQLGYKDDMVGGVYNNHYIMRWDGSVDKRSDDGKSYTNIKPSRSMSLEDMYNFALDKMLESKTLTESWTDPVTNNPIEFKFDTTMVRSFGFPKEVSYNVYKSTDDNFSAYINTEPRSNEAYTKPYEVRIFDKRPRKSVSMYVETFDNLDDAKRYLGV